MRIPPLLSVKDALFSSIPILVRKNALHKSRFYWFSMRFITPASISARKVIVDEISVNEMSVDDTHTHIHIHTRSVVDEMSVDELLWYLLRQILLSIIWRCATIMIDRCRKQCACTCMSQVLGKLGVMTWLTANESFKNKNGVTKHIACTCTCMLSHHQYPQIHVSFCVLAYEGFHCMYMYMYVFI